MKLRAYQSSAIDKCREHMASGLRRLVLYSATGSGKTIIGISFIASALAKGKRVAFIANRITLVGQASAQLTKAGIDHGIIQGQNTYGQHKPCIVCSIQTVARRGLPNVDLIVIDEAHGVPGSKDYLKLIFSNNNIPVVGLTATPFSKGMAKTHKELLDEPLFESLVVATTIRELIDTGFLVDCDIYAPSEPDLSGVRTQRNQFGEVDYNEKDLGEAVDKPTLVGDIVSHWLRMSKGKPTVVFATTIAHSRHIVEKFMEAGVSAGHLDGYMSEEDREEVLGKMSRGEITVLSNVAVLREGWDFPACEVMILARPTKSLIAWIQMVGRVLRPHPGKTRALVLDHSGSTHELGYPTDDLPLELCDGSLKRSEKKREKKERKCPACSYMKKSGGACPQCGFEPVKNPAEVEVADGELALVSRLEKKSRFDKQDAWSQLLAVKHERGYSDGWVSHQYRKLFGVWPRGLEDVVKEPSKDMRNWLLGQRIRFAKGKNKELRHAA